MAWDSVSSDRQNLDPDLENLIVRLIKEETRMTAEDEEVDAAESTKKKSADSNNKRNGSRGNTSAKNRNKVLLSCHKLGYYASEYRKIKKGTRKCIDQNKSENCAFIVSSGDSRTNSVKNHANREVCFRETNKKWLQRDFCGFLTYR